MNRIEQFYDANPQYEWERLERHRVEYGITLLSLQEHLPAPPAAIIDVDGSVGRYAIELARRGYAVTLVDISAACLEFARAKAAERNVELTGCARADARDLAGFAEASFDAALLMGPLYHLLDHAERLRAVREARRLLRPGGPVFAVFIGRYAPIQYAAAQRPEYISALPEELESILGSGVYRRPAGSEGFIDAWFAHPADVPPLMAEGGFEQLDLIGCEPLVNELEARVNQAPPELHRQWIELLYRLSRDESLLGACAHLLYVGRRPL